MCGRFLLESDVEELLRFYKIANEVSFSIENKVVYPTQLSPVIIERSAKNRMGLMQWGFDIPGLNRPIINSRVEGIFSKKSFKESILTKRCIVPATGFLEWKDKIPHTFKDPHKSFLSFAGIYQKHMDDNGQIKWQFSILTRSASKYMIEVHDRMPLMLTREVVNDWLSAETRMEGLQKLMNFDIGELEITC